MMKKMDEEHKTNEAIKFKDFYINLIENNQKDLPFYLSSNIVLDWFGKTIKTRQMVTSYFRDAIGKITHDLNDVKFVEKVAFRDSHEIKIPKEESVMIISSPTQLNHFNNNNYNDNMVTPPPSSSSSSSSTSTSSTIAKQIVPSTSHNSLEIGQGDGIQNVLMSPCKKMKLLSDIDDEEKNNVVNNNNKNNNEDVGHNLKYATTYGRIEFRRPSVKKFQTETKWERPIKLHIGYDNTSNNLKECTIYLIIYESNLKCRRNLYKDFCENDQQQQEQKNDND